MENPAVKSPAVKEPVANEAHASLSERLNDIKKEINHLATDDVASVVKSLRTTLSRDLSEKPYQTLALAVGVGYGLGKLNKEHLKTAALQVGKLVALRSLSKI